MGDGLTIEQVFENWGRKKSGRVEHQCSKPSFTVRFFSRSPAIPGNGANVKTFRECRATNSEWNPTKSAKRNDRRGREKKLQVISGVIQEGVQESFFDKKRRKK